MTVAPEVLAELDGEVADAAGGAGDQQFLAGLQLRVVLQRLHRGAAGDRQRRRGREVDAVGNRRHLVTRDGDHLRQRALAAEGRQRAENALADEVAGRAAADSDDLAGEVAADATRRPVEHRHQRQMTGTNLPVEGIEADRAHAQLEPARRARGLGDLGDVEPVGRAVAVVAQGLHRTRASVAVQRVLAQRRQRNDGQRFLVRRREHDRRRPPGRVGFAPATGAQAPAVAGLQSRKPNSGAGVVRSLPCARE